MLVDEENGNVLALLGEAVKGLFDGVRLGLVVDNEVVLLRVRRVGNVLYSEVRGLVVVCALASSYSDSSKQDTGHRVLEDERQLGQGCE